MGYRTIARSFAVLVVVSFFVSDLPTADAQGLLRRLRARSQAVQPQPTPARPQYRVPQQLPAARVQPQQRVAPSSNQRSQVSPSSGVIYRVDPRTGRIVGTIRRPTTAPSVSQPAARPRTVQPAQPIRPATRASTPQAPPAKDRNSTGQSILDTSNPAPDDQATLVRPTLGLQVKESFNGVPALEVESFKEHSLADDAGLRIGDRIYYLNGQATPSINVLTEMLERLTPGQSVRLRIVRGNQVGDITVPLVRHPSMLSSGATAKSQLGSPQVASPSADVSKRTLPPSFGTPSQAASRRTESMHSVLERPATASADTTRLGVEVQDASGTRGAVVLNVLPNSPAKRAGLQVGDRIVSVDGRMIEGSSALSREVQMKSIDESMAVQLVRSNRLVTSRISLDEKTRMGQSVLMKDDVDQSAAESQGEPAAESSKQATGGVLGSVGSMLGGLFSGNTQSSGNAPATGDAAPASMDDEMDFGDGEPINHGVFQTSSDALTGTPPAPLSTETPERALDRDPPSVEQLDPPVLEAKKPPVPDANVEDATKQVRALQAEIDRLKAKLDEINSD